MSVIDDVVRKISSFAREQKPFLFAFDFELEEAIFVPYPLQQQEVLFKTPQACNYEAWVPPHDYPFAATPLSFDAYGVAFDVVQRGLHRGDSYLTNLTVQTPISTTLTLEEILHYSHAPYCLYLPHRFVCFSPERFIAIDASGRISTYPMKGTIDASLPDAAQRLLKNEKELAEHTTVVDLLRNDLGMVANHIEVRQFRFLSKVETHRGAIFQTSSEVLGQLPDGYRNHLGETILQLLPAGSICGAPKRATLALIAQAERQKRGYYTGVFGYYDGQTLDTAVLIRYIENVAGQLFFRSGGGITVMSEKQSEYQEVIDKVYLPFV